MNMIYSTVGCSRMCHSDMKEIPLVLKRDKIFSVVENSFTENMYFFSNLKKKKNWGWCQNLYRVAPSLMLMLCSHWMNIMDFFFYKNDPTSFYHTAENIAKFVEMCLSLCANNMPHFDNVEHHLHTLLHFQEKKKIIFFSLSLFFYYLSHSVYYVACSVFKTHLKWTGAFFLQGI